MPRPITKGLQYTFLDKDFFHDRKVRKLVRECGKDSPIVYIALLTMIAGEGYYIKYDNDTVFDLADYTGIDEGRVVTILETCGKVGLLDMGLMEHEHILTSHGIQKYYKNTCFQLKRKNGVEEYCLLEEGHIDDVSSEETPENNEKSEFPPKKPSKNRVSSGEIPTKEEKGKEKKNKENSFSSLSSFSEEEKQQQEDFFLEEMFFKNWQDPNAEFKKFIAFNNTGGRVWEKMSATERDAAFELWKQKPEQQPRFPSGFLDIWKKVVSDIKSLNAAPHIISAALDDGLAVEVRKPKLIIRCPAVLKDYIEEPDNMQVLITPLRALLKKFGCSNLKYREFDIGGDL